MLAETSNLVPWAMIAVAVGCAYVVIRRVSLRDPQNESSPSSAPEDGLSRREIGVAARIDRLEVRLHDFAREAESRMETRTAALEGLIAAADREIIRLTDLVNVAQTNSARVPDIMRFAESSAGAPATPPAANPVEGMSAAQQQIVWHLHEAGYVVAEIAHIVNQPPETVQAALRAAA